MEIIRRTMLLVALILLVGVSLGMQGDCTNCSETFLQGYYVNVANGGGYKMTDLSYKIQGMVGDHLLARCYDAGGEATGSFIILFGSYSSEDFGEYCDTFIDLVIISGDDHIAAPHLWPPCKQAKERGLPDKLPVEYAPSEYPTKGRLFVRVKEEALLLKPRETFEGILYAQSMERDNIYPGWNYLDIVRIGE